MRDDFTMIIKKIPNNRNIKIYPISDVHLGAIEHMEKEWEEFRKRVEKEEDSYIILAGDLINNGIRTSVGNPFDQTMRPREQKKLMIEHLEPLRDKILCMVGGNHERRTTKDTDESPSYDIACKLDLEEVYRENLAFLKIQFGKQDGNGTRNPTYTFAVTHGAGSSIYTTNAAMRGERFGMAIDGIDVMVLGHIHKPQDFPVGKYLVDGHNNKVSVKPYEVFVCTSWLKYSGYAAQKMLSPTVFSPADITLHGKKKAIEISRTLNF
ncbi:MAG: metallophosphoesterase [Bacteroidaceae bacterium]|jgi:predicted phosphodiesterase|nr:metallophosphoesterase [Bacteroidaceae bacterium]